MVRKIGQQTRKYVLYMSQLNENGEPEMKKCTRCKAWIPFEKVNAHDKVCKRVRGPYNKVKTLRTLEILEDLEARGH